jgi:hypothetical protein
MTPHNGGLCFAIELCRTCDRHATVWPHHEPGHEPLLRTVEGEDVPAVYCAKHGRELIDRYQTEMQEPWSLVEIRTYDPDTCEGEKPFSYLEEKNR